MDFRHALLGDAPEFQAQPLDFFQRLASEHGDVAPFRLGPLRAYYLNHPDYVHQVLVKDHAKFQKSLVIKMAMGKFIKNGLVSSDGDFWKQQRKLMQPAFHYSRIEGYAQTMVECARDLRWDQPQVEDIEAVMLDLTLRIVNRTLFSNDLSEATSQRVAGAMHQFQQIVGQEAKAPSFVPTWIPNKRNRELKETLTLLHDTINAIIDQRRAEGVDKGDLLSMLLFSQYDDGTFMPDDQVRDEALTLFIAGHETTGIALSWLLYLLAQHPEVEARLLEELDTVLAGRTPTLHDLPQLVYTEMVMKEAMRLYPPAWMTSRETLEAVEVGGQIIPKGAMVFLSPYLTQRDPRWWNAPEQFNPERFAKGNEDALPRYAYWPFGGGPRVCIGNTFASMEIRLVLATLLTRYQFSLSDGQAPAFAPLATLRSQEGILMRIRQREQLAVL